MKLQTTLTTGMAAPTGGGRGTMQYKAPELFCTRRMDPALYERRYAKPADVYSFAMLAWEVFTGKVPWLGTPDEELVAIQVDALRHAGAIERPVAGADWAPPDVVALVEACWAQAPEVRPSHEVDWAKNKHWNTEKHNRRVRNCLVRGLLKSRRSVQVRLSGNSLDPLVRSGDVGAGE